MWPAVGKTFSKKCCANWVIISRAEVIFGRKTIWRRYIKERRVTVGWQFQGRTRKEAYSGGVACYKRQSTIVTRDAIVVITSGGRIRDNFIAPDDNFAINMVCVLSQCATSWTLIIVLLHRIMASDWLKAAGGQRQLNSRPLFVIIMRRGCSFVDGEFF